MTSTLQPDFTITYTARRLACVIDSSLALSIYGLPIAKRLGEWMELWIVREFWHLLESVPASACSRPQLEPALQQTLLEWERLRQHVDPQHRPVHVLADVLGDSCLPAGSDPDLLWRWERLARNLDERLEARGIRLDGQVMALRDLVALAVARSACIFTLQTSRDPQGPPPLCQTLRQWGVECEAVRSGDPLMAIEASWMQQRFVQAGLASLLWSGMNLCVVHLFVPAAASLAAAQAWNEYEHASDSLQLDGADPTIDPCLWDGVRAFWYGLNDIHSSSSH